MRLTKKLQLKLLTLITLCAVLLSVGSLCLPVAAEYYTDISSLELTLAAGDENMGFPSSVNSAALKEHILSELAAFKSSIDLRQFNIPFNSETKLLLEALVLYDTPEIFHLNGYSTMYLSGYITSIKPVYYYTQSEYTKMLAEMNKVADDMTADLVNSSLGDIEKALILHDRLADWCEYDYTYYQTNGASDPRSTHTPHGALVNRRAVCQGYTMAYSMLLQRVGIVSRYCTSPSLYHSWNIIFIDGKAYHADVTWNDGWINGEVKHDFFMVSTDNLNSYPGHAASDYDSLPSDKTYDSGVWHKARSGFQLVGGELYFIDETSQTINRYVSEKKSVVCFNIPDKWGNWNPSYYSRLASDGNVLFYTSGYAIYSYDPATGKTAQVKRPAEAQGEDRIYGLRYEDGYIYYSIYSSPNYFSNESYTSLATNYSFKYEPKLEPEKFPLKISAPEDKAVNVTVYFEGEEVATAKISGGSYTLELPEGDYSVTVSAEGCCDRSYPVTVGSSGAELSTELLEMGDVTGDGSISVIDCQKIFNHVSKARLLTGYSLACSDINGDGAVTVADVQLLASLIVSK